MDSWTIGLLNTNSLRNKMPYLLHILQTQNIDIMIINDHRLTSPPIIQGYLTNSFTAGTRHVGGSLIITRDGLQIVSTSGNLGTPPMDSTHVTVRSGPTTLSIVTTYARPSQNTDHTLYWQEVFDRNPKVLLAGDLNAKSPDLGSTAENDRGKRLVRFLQDCDVNMINDDRPTFFPNNIDHHPSRLDFMICSTRISHLFRNFRTIHEFPSDHDVLLVDYAGTRILPPPKPRHISFDMRNCDEKWPIFQENLDAVLQDSIPDLQTHEDIEVESEVLSSSILQAAKKSFPPLPTKIRKPSVPDELLLLIKQKHRLRRQ